MLLHGDLFVTVHEAKELKSVGKLMFKSQPDPYVKAYVGEGTIFKSEWRENTTEPKWEETFVMPFAYHGEAIKFSVKHASKHLGEVNMPFERIINDRKISEWFSLRSEHIHRDCGQLRLTIKFSPAVDYHSSGSEVPHCYFSLKKGCKVRLYQDAICHYNQLPSAPLKDGNLYANGSCWEDLYQKLQRAEKFIYATGWSFWVHTVFVRNAYDGASHFGNLLKAKAASGVRVCMLVWDDQTSGTVFMGKEGLMGTKDEETREFFKNTNVNAKLVARETDDKTAFHKRAFATAVYTHHQKSVIMDQPDEVRGRKRIVCFVGGLDITTGRYDTPEHPIFRTLQTDEHREDFYSNCIAGINPETGPRQPWHDIHGYLEGAVARDVMQNFEERWYKQAAEDINKLFDLNADPSIIWLGDEAIVSEEEDPETWHCQYFRSIDGRSAVFDAKALANSEVFFRKKGRPIDMSIQRAYAHYIRNAENFIYIENQYFLGSSNEWKKGVFGDSLASTDGATHVIPMEIALKIAAKIRAGEHFCAYILIPLYSEGIPESGAVQEILCWQRNTVELMYNTINEELRRHQDLHPGKKPTDFLSFFCLGQREYPPEDAVHDPIAKLGRHMIYVHSKMLIVDDSTILIGSANINQRSMDGGRDTEMAFGAYQPHHLVENKNLPRGQIHGFRKSLFAEHMGAKFYDWFDTPDTPEAMRAAREIGEENWKIYADDNLQLMNSHWMNYPYSIDDATGSVFADPLNQKFPGTDAKVLGKDDLFMPDSATM